MLIIWKAIGFPYFEKRGSISHAFVLYLHIKNPPNWRNFHKDQIIIDHLDLLRRPPQRIIHSLLIFVAHLLWERLELGLGNTHRLTTLKEQSRWS